MAKCLLSRIVVLLAVSAQSQIRVATITNETDPPSKAMMTSLRGKLASHPKQFTLVGTHDSTLSLLVTADCMPQAKNTDPFVCFYTSDYAGGATKTFMGGGIYASATADEVADDFLAAIAQDIVERWK
jgi:hypothetical protein